MTQEQLQKGMGLERSIRTAKYDVMEFERRNWKLIVGETAVKGDSREPEDKAIINALEKVISNYLNERVEYLQKQFDAL